MDLGSQPSAKAAGPGDAYMEIGKAIIFRDRIFRVVKRNPASNGG